MGYLYRNRAVTGLVLKSEEAARQEARESVSGTCFGALGTNAFRPLGRDLGMQKGSRGGTWAIRHRQVLLKLLARRCLDCFGAVPAGRQFIAEGRGMKTFWNLYQSADFLYSMP